MRTQYETDTRPSGGCTEEDAITKFGPPDEVPMQFRTAPQPQRLCCIGCVWIFSAYVQSCRNKLAAARGESKRSPALRVRTALLVSLAGFVVCLALGMAVSAKLAGRLDFWNDWNWFYIHNCRTYDIPIQ